MAMNFALSSLVCVLVCLALRGYGLATPGLYKSLHFDDSLVHEDTALCSLESLKEREYYLRAVYNLWATADTYKNLLRTAPADMKVPSMDLVYNAGFARFVNPSKWDYHETMASQFYAENENSWTKRILELTKAGAFASRSLIYTELQLFYAKKLEKLTYCEERKYSCYPINTFQISNYTVARLQKNAFFTQLVSETNLNGKLALLRSKMDANITWLFSSMLLTFNKMKYVAKVLQKQKVDFDLKKLELQVAGDVLLPVYYNLDPKDHRPVIEDYVELRKLAALENDYKATLFQNGPELEAYLILAENDVHNAVLLVDTEPKPN